MDAPTITITKDDVYLRLVRVGFKPDHAAQLAGAIHGRRFKKEEREYERRGGRVGPKLAYGGM